MTAKEFWEEEPTLMWAYRISFLNKMKIEQEMTNYKCWLQGAYFFDAMSKAIYNSFGRKNGQQAENYVSEPFDFKAMDKENKEKIEQEQREEKIKEEMERVKRVLQRQKGG